MNQEFLVRFRKAPRPEFAEALYKKISQEEERRMPILSYIRLSALQRLTLGLAAIGLVFAGGILASPAVRAQVANLLDKYWTRIYIGEISYTQGSYNPNSTGGEPATTSLSTSLVEAQAMLPTMRVPVWAPESFVLGDKVLINLPIKDKFPNFPFDVTVHLIWRKSTKDEVIFLRVIKPRTEDTWENIVWIVDWEGSLEEITIKGEPASLARESGWWSLDTQQWNETGVMSLTWKQDDGVLYTLIAPEAVVSVDDLVQMAESMP